MAAPNTKFQLIKDDDFDFEINRMIGHARYNGSDVREVLQLCSRIIPGDMDSWHQEFLTLAKRVEASAGTDSNNPSRRVSKMDRLFHASNYYRATDFFLHGHPEDPRIMQMWQKQTECFDKAIELLGNGKRYNLKADTFSVPIIYFEAPGSGPKPTMILGNGFDGAMEELLHVSGFAALERGYNVILYDGPGQPTVRREQNLGFIPDWERVVTPVVDFAYEQPEVDRKNIVLFGYSMGGYLAVRAAAFEHRLAAVFCVDGVFDVAPAFRPPNFMLEALNAGKKDEFNEHMRKFMFDPSTPTGERWMCQQALWSFNVPEASDFVEALNQYNMRGVVDQVECPVFVGLAEEDIFFKGQPEQLAKALGSKAYLHTFTTEDGVGLHCQVGGVALLNVAIYDWFERSVRT